MISFLSPDRQSAIRSVLFTATGLKVDRPWLVNGIPRAVVLPKLRGMFGKTVVQNSEHILAIVRRLPFLREAGDVLLRIVQGLRDQIRSSRAFQKLSRCHAFKVCGVFGHGHLTETRTATLSTFRDAVIARSPEHAPVSSSHRGAFCCNSSSPRTPGPCRKPRQPVHRWVSGATNAEGGRRDENGLVAEDFGLGDNLMLEGAIRKAGREVAESFEACVRQARAWYGR